MPRGSSPWAFLMSSSYLPALPVDRLDEDKDQVDEDMDGWMDQVDG